jgi:dihydroflavonol-4-reductase
VKALVTGATGLVGNALCHLLVERGHTVRALVRQPDRARSLLPAAVECVAGDITRPPLEPACQGVEVLFHAAGMPEQWQPDEAIFDRINHLGTRAMLEAARQAGVKRAVYTSTMDVFAAPAGGTLVESNIDPAPKHTAYERSKQAAERAAEEVRARGLEVVYVNPAAVYGPSPVHVALNDYFVRLLRRQVPLTPPGGVSVAYVSGVAEAHLAAAERGVPGERYLLADAHLSMRQLAGEIASAAGLSRLPPAAPAWLMKAVATVSAPVARALKVQPLVAPGQMTFLLWDAHVDASKAQRELGFRPTPVGSGVRQTVEFLRAKGLVPPAGGH